MSYVDIFRHVLGGHRTKGSASMNLTEFLDATMSDVTCGLLPVVTSEKHVFFWHLHDDLQYLIEDS